MIDCENGVPQAAKYLKDGPLEEWQFKFEDHVYYYGFPICRRAAANKVVAMAQKKLGIDNVEDLRPDTNEKHAEAFSRASDVYHRRLIRIFREEKRRAVSIFPCVPPNSIKSSFGDSDSWCKVYATLITNKIELQLVDHDRYKKILEQLQEFFRGIWEPVDAHWFFGSLDFQSGDMRNNPQLVRMIQWRVQTEVARLTKEQSKETK